MKKLIFSFLALLMFSFSMMKAQNMISPDKYWQSPSSYAMNEQITWYFDFASTSPSALPDGADLYMWIWVPANPVAGLPDPNQDKVKLSYNGNRVWSITFTPTEFFGMSAADILANEESSFYFLLRSLNATDYITGTLSFPKIDFVQRFIDSGKMWDYTSTNDGKVTSESTVTLWFNSNLADGFDHTSDVHIHAGYNNFADHIIEYHAWETTGCAPQSACYTQMEYLGNGIYKKDLVPYEYFQAGPEENFENFEFLFVQKDWSATTANQVVYAANVAPPPPANLYFFPVKVSQKDILVITRQWNNRGQFLSYEIKAGSKTLTGDFSGVKPMEMQRAFINLADELKGQNVSTLNVLVKDQNGNEIYKGDIQLVKPDL